MKRKWKSNMIWVAILVIGAILLIVFAFYERYTPANTWFQDPENDVMFNIGTECPGMIDVINASLEAHENTLEITIHTRDPIRDLSDGEYAQWNVTMILQDEYAYEVCVKKNRTRLEGYFVEIGEWNMSTCQVECHGNSLTIVASIDELEGTQEIEWFVLTMFERLSQDEIMVSGYDVAPDDGFKTTIIEE